MSNKTAFVFPAFITEFTGKELDFIQRNNLSLSSYINKASELIGYNLPEFAYENNEYQNNEFLSQLLAYIFSCSISDILLLKDLKPNFVAGYSMGIYAALYSTGAISFSDGIRIIKSAFDLTEELRVSEDYGMGSIIGLSIDDVNILINNTNHTTEIININNEYSLVVAGKKREIKKILREAKNEGALSTTELTVNTPYHSEYMLKYSDEFASFVDSLQIKTPRCPIISTFDQREITEAAELKKELVFNLTRKINWFGTMQIIIEKNVTEFYECGAGKDLKKISRFICGNYQLKLVHKI
ncbi:MAG: ACP S-malonyltransferase [Bacteroidales bacterium]|nr:ACP S-malonyltransferase [Bacteroidales bacterium]